jgi:hypothetical protein
MNVGVHTFGLVVKPFDRLSDLDDDLPLGYQG